MLESYSVLNFRSLAEESFDFGTLNIFLGPNNCGKSSLMRAISFLPRIVNDQEPVRKTVFLDLMDGNGWDQIPGRHADSREVSMRYVLNAEGWKTSPLVYSFAFHAGEREGIPDSFRITEESLEYSRPTPNDKEPFCFFRRIGPDKGRFSVSEDGRKRFLELSLRRDENIFRQDRYLLQDETFRGEIYPLFSEGLEKAKDALGVFRSYSSTELRLDLLRFSAKPEDEDRFLLANASNFVRVLQAVSKQAPGYLEDFSVACASFIKSLSGFRFEDAQDGTTRLSCILEGRPFDLAELSDGSRKLMIHLFLLTAPLKTDALALDEPELNIHPAWLSALAREILRHSAPSRQIFLSTHSPDLLDGFTEAFRRHPDRVRLFVFDKNRDSGRFVHLLPERLDVFFEEGWELGDLYRVGEPVLGGWPW